MTVNLDSRCVVRLMAEKAMTTAALSRTIGMKPQNLGQIIKRGTCSHINASRIASALGVAFDVVTSSEDAHV